MNRFHADYYALQLGDHVLGGGFYATRLYRDMRQKAGYVYNVDNSLHAGENAGADIFGDLRLRSGERLAEGARAGRAGTAPRRCAPTNVSPAELQQAKALLLRSITLSESSEDAVAGGFVARALVGLPLDESFRAAQKYYDLTADDVRKAFEKWIRPEALVQVST